MRITANQLHFSAISSQALQDMPKDVSSDFKAGYESFLDLFYVGCFAQDLENTQEDHSTYIDLSRVFEYVFEELRSDHARWPFHGDTKEFWTGYFQAQEKAERIFNLAYTPDIEVA